MCFSAAEVTEESEHLRQMNEALIQDSIREEINFCDKELQQLSQRVCNLNVDVSETMNYFSFILVYCVAEFCIFGLPTDVNHISLSKQILTHYVFSTVGTRLD